MLHHIVDGALGLGPIQLLIVTVPLVGYCRQGEYPDFGWLLNTVVQIVDRDTVPSPFSSSIHMLLNDVLYHSSRSAGNAYVQDSFAVSPSSQTMCQ